MNGLILDLPDDIDGPEPFTLITGASSGIGRETAIFLSKFRRLIIHGRDQARMEETRRECHGSARHLLWTHDLKNVAGIETSFSGFIRSHGITVRDFVHCAGMIAVMPLRQLDLDALNALMNVNCNSAIEMSRLLISKRINQQHLKHIVLISSTASKFGARGFHSYCASKAALDGFMRAAAVELAPQVRVNSILPGAVETPMTEQLLADPVVRSRLVASYPLGIGETGDIAAAVGFLLSDQAKWITGQQFVIDGGRSVNATA